jgi:GTP-binding protein
MMVQTGAWDKTASMDSNALEQERGITIYAKNTSVMYKDTKINIVDTPGHADFGSEVERVLRSIDSVLLVVDAQEGPMPQTRFVLMKSLELGHRPIVVINKIDKPAANPAWVEDQVLELFLELGANDEQCDFPVIYAIGVQGASKTERDGELQDLTPLLETILQEVDPAPGFDPEQSLRAQVFNLGYDNFLGRLGVVRVYQGRMRVGEQVHTIQESRDTERGKLTKLQTFTGVTTTEVDTVEAGDIALVAGLTNVHIGDTIVHDSGMSPLPAINVDEPTIAMRFMANNSPFMGRAGTYVTSRQIRERLEKELEVNVGLQVDFSSGDSFTVYGRGEMHIAILLENMRREGYEIAVSQPQVIVKEVDGVTVEPFEEVTIDVPSEYQGTVIERLGQRGFIMTNLVPHEAQVRILLEGPTRGILGYKNQFVVDTRGTGIMATRVLGFRPYAGEIHKRVVGSMVSMVQGKALGFALFGLQDRGQLYITPGTEVYEGMVIGNSSKGEELVVNPTKGKQLTNMRSSGADEAINLVPPKEVTIESGLEIMADDEYLEITPEAVRLRKAHLKEADRKRAR